MKHIIEFGRGLLREYHRLDDIIVDRKYLQHNDDSAIKEDFKWMLKDIDNFNSEAERFVNDVKEICGSRTILLNNRQHDYVNDYEVDSPILREFYTYGLTLTQVMEQLESLSNGKTKKRKYDNKFHYERLERILYRNETEFAIRSKQMKRESLVELAFERATGEGWVTAEEIENRRTEKTGYDEDLKNPNEWIRKACDALNTDTRIRFKIDYDLFEKDSARIRLNPKAR